MVQLLSQSYLLIDRTAPELWFLLLLDTTTSTNYLILTVTSPKKLTQKDILKKKERIFWKKN